MPLIGTLNDFQPNTTIVSSDVDQNFNDIKTAFNSSAVLTDVAKTVTVTHDWNAAQDFHAGSVSAPGIYLNGDTNTGFYQIGGDNWGWAANGAKVVDLGTAGVAVTGTLSSSGALTVSAGGLTVTAGGLTVSAGTTAVQALTATTGSFSSTLAVTGAATFSGGINLADSEDVLQWSGGNGVVEWSGTLFLRPTGAGTNSLQLTSGAASFPGTLSVTGTSTLTGIVAIGSSTNSGQALRVAHTGTTGTSQYGVIQIGTFSSQATSSGYGVWSRAATEAATFTMSNAYAFYAANALKGSGSTITTTYGLYVEAQTSGGTNYAIYTAGTTESRFGGAIIATNHIRQETATTTLNLSGGTATNLGGNINLYGESHASTPGIITFRSGATEYLRLNASGNIGLGTTDIEAWYTPYRVIEGVFGALILGSGDGTAALTQGAYRDATNWKRKTTLAASLLDMTNGAIAFKVAASGAADTAISWTTALTIANSGAATFGSTVSATQYTSTIATGTAPLVVTSTTVVSNLNADLLDGQHASAFALASHSHDANTLTGTTLASGVTASSLTSVGTLTSLTVSGALTAGSLNLGGATVTDILSASFTWDPGTISAGAVATTTVAVTGAAVGDVVTLAEVWRATRQDCVMFAYVSAADTVTVGIYNPTGGNINMTSRTGRVVVHKF